MTYDEPLPDHLSRSGQLEEIAQRLINTIGRVSTASGRDPFIIYAHAARILPEVRAMIEQAATTHGPGALEFVTIHMTRLLDDADKFARILKPVNPKDPPPCPTTTTPPRLTSATRTRNWR